MTRTELTTFIDQTSSASHLRVEEHLGDGFVRLRIDEAERRQAKHDIRTSEDAVIELLRNSRDAHARMIFLSSTKEGEKRRITIVDDGDGIPEGMHERIFDPRVTSKLDSMHVDKWGVHGRGMALYGVRVNAEHAEVKLSRPALGTSIQVLFDTRAISEKADQSSFPTFVLTEGNKITIRGPKNILRTAAEFALEHRNSLSVFVGSPAEIASALYHYGIAVVSPALRAFNRGASEASVVKRLAFSADPEEFALIANELGLEMSERTARRIMDGLIEPAVPVLERISIQTATDVPPSTTASQMPPKAAPRGDMRSFKMSDSDREAFEKEVQSAYMEIAEKYYLEPNVSPQVKVSKDAIRITIPVVKQN